MNEPNKLMQVLSFTADKTCEMASANSIVGDAIEKDGVTVIPVSEVSVGFAGGGADSCKGKKSSQPAGAGGKVDRRPYAFIVMDQNGVSVRKAATDAKAPDLLSSLKKLLSKKK